MKAQPTSHISPEVHQTTTTPVDNRVQRQSESSSPRSSTSSWVEEPVTTVDMDIMTGHLILVCRLL